MPASPPISIFGLPRPKEVELVRDVLDADWLRRDLEKSAVHFATMDLAQKHISEVKARRIPEIEKVEQEVQARLKEGDKLLGFQSLRAQGGKNGPGRKPG